MISLLASPEISSSPSKRKRNVGSQTRKLFLTHKADGVPNIPVQTIQIFGGKFKILLKLHPGLNLLEFEFCRIFKTLSVFFDPPSVEWHPHRIGLVYIVCANTNGSFQAPKGTRYAIHLTGYFLSLKSSNGPFINDVMHQRGKGLAFYLHPETY